MSKLLKIFFLLSVISVGMAGISFGVTTYCLIGKLCYIDPNTPPVTATEALSFAGTIVTVLAFVAAFFILLMAIDAFAVSNTVAANASKVKDNTLKIEEIEGSAKNLFELTADIETEIRKHEEKSAQASKFFESLELFVEEIDDAYSSEDQIHFVLEVMAKRFDLDEPLINILKRSRADSGNRRMRINAIASILALDLGKVVDFHSLSALPELRNAAESGDEKSKILLDALKVRMES